MKTKLSILLSAILFSVVSYGQNTDTYKRELKGISETWHKMVIPDAMFGKTKEDLSDIRIYGITEKHDTVEAPYLIRKLTDKTKIETVEFTLLNTTKNEKGYYFTFETPHREPVNKIELSFNNSDFDWRIQLQGSNDQKEWFTLLEEYRIVAINNFRFTELNFPTAKYAYYRVVIPTNNKPELERTLLSSQTKIPGEHKTYTPQKIHTFFEKNTKETVIEADYNMALPISSVHINISDNFDYYRPVTIYGAIDSVPMERGWLLNYKTVFKGTLNSINQEAFTFSTTKVKKLKIVIEDNDNQPLTISGIETTGYLYEIIARFTQKGDYYMAYGNPTATIPDYDISRFTDNIPEELTAIQVGNEEVITWDSTTHTPLFINKNWLWAVMVVIILILGWFSVKMLKKG